MSEVSLAQNVLINYHPSLACGLTSLLTGLTLFYVVYINIQNNNQTQVVNLDQQKNRRVHLIPKFEGTFSSDDLNSALEETDKNLAAPEETDKNLAARVKAWKALNEVPVFSSVRPGEHFIYIGTTHTRLGNLIFQFVSGLAIGRILNRTVLFSPNFMELLQIFPNTTSYMQMAPMAINSGVVPLPMIKETGAGFYEDWLYKAVPKTLDVQICCFLQSYKYFRDIEDEVRQMLQPSQTLVDKVSQFTQKIIKHDQAKRGIKSAPKTFVGVHVRRGDMSTRGAWQSGRLTASVQYIKLAMNYYRKHFSNVHFIICSDDINWCLKNIPESNDVTFSQSNDDKFDLVLLSSCDHSIMTVGTYGWWGSWLANGTVLYYDFQNKPGSFYGRRMHSEDYFPSSWIPMAKISWNTRL